MRILLHICCAPCYAKALSGLRDVLQEKSEITGYWYNPNIHPLIEYRRRMKAFLVFSHSQNLPQMLTDQYGLSEFCHQINDDHSVPQRCAVCYRMRLDQTAKMAAEQGFDAFTTTLNTSLHQSHELIRQAGQVASEKFGIPFLYHDLRQAEPDAKTLHGIYKQQYCGCVFSEYDRYENTTLHLYKG